MNDLKSVGFNCRDLTAAQVHVVLPSSEYLLFFLQCRLDRPYLSSSRMPSALAAILASRSERCADLVEIWSD